MSSHPPRPTRTGKHFTPFYSAAEEALARAEEEGWDNEGGKADSSSAGLRTIIRVDAAFFT